MRTLIPFTLVLLAPTPAGADDAVKAWAAKLSSEKPSEWRVAQAYLARAGAGALPELEKLAAGTADPTKRRLTETVSLMLRNAAGPEAVRKQPKLWALCEPEVKRAAGPLKVLAVAKDYDSGERGLMPPGTPPPPPSAPRRALDDLYALHGFAVPAALELLADKQPGSRTYGVEILRGLNAVGQHRAVEGMVKDGGPVRPFRGCYHENTTVGELTAKWLKAGALRPAGAPDEKYAVCFEAENYADWLDHFAGPTAGRTDLVNWLRQDAKTAEAASWDDYWRRAKPVLEKAWDKK